MDHCEKNSVLRRVIRQIIKDALHGCFASFIGSWILAPYWPYMDFPYTMGAIGLVIGALIYPTQLLWRVLFK